MNLQKVGFYFVDTSPLIGTERASARRIMYVPDMSHDILKPFERFFARSTDVLLSTGHTTMPGRLGLLGVCKWGGLGE